MSHLFLCSMGANIRPEQHFAAARELISDLGTAHYSRSIYTEPVAIETSRDFLNALFLLQTDYDAEELKQRFNQIEATLGRDRSDPQSSQKDRPMDIDIIGDLNGADTERVWQQVPAYLSGVADPLYQFSLQGEHFA
ncbi:2-amino-4-hydroxy-6-hydroxymethyldihydropteridine diphosphokinase [Pseudidiomarina sp.]|uniref:2-amino-4-hydroxy-6- hydroxymethyldihydropteridine diphosphokinase n=1 Tax=Pseudidiomarina sp. TaxID=2081707 RepID=UPI00299D36DD|nr:2-amino-4-hydroxy-6-hydroxymethyldihydropteridine diphosphokinase [Pseudidiomarina sp.]MDX1706422.1 2-amino-4-hydroxy-6-hydroxymethyldihydropteridine diphosphokinase [Pseudidiomarina sp.]